MPSPTELLAATYRSLSEQVADLRPEEAWQPSGCAGWAVLDLTLHLVDDARRGLVALATPADGPATSDAVAYWRAWQPTAAQDEDVAWRTRVRASVAGGLTELSAVHAELVAAVTVLAERIASDDLVGTQGHVLRAGDLLSTLAVEAAVHHLDLVAHLDRPGPAPEALAEVRRVLEGLLGGPLPAGWDDATAARRGTGRAPLDDADRAALGSSAERFPLFG
ncbi:maleylpyruvate isomerase N-terminal domain-containing protein [Geodermatophilus poikilotrophus]|uniref:Mycothiol maleylpyruvate isomerase N-terminal domain-containing protein n=1 Tax=Geodermatophilus poikilotrophus TaxID=1333667 RepID=A0A1I0IJ78_9ACTN|nr:maleylpyruvate isomerase N-terminal domain-containing protein [Geodermatophilus poikilotrophus]SET97099.1 Mycothiol maleylpyruvate isomerase N-terminal domain-containing protein [Geodermatophilus poikilotrophus]